MQTVYTFWRPRATPAAHMASALRALRFPGQRVSSDTLASVRNRCSSLLLRFCLARATAPWLHPSTRKPSGNHPETMLALACPSAIFRTRAWVWALDHKPWVFVSQSCPFCPQSFWHPLISEALPICASWIDVVQQPLKTVPQVSCWVSEAHYPQVAKRISRKAFEARPRSCTSPSALRTDGDPICKTRLLVIPKSKVVPSMISMPWSEYIGIWLWV